MNVRPCALSDDTAAMRELAGISDEEWANGELDIEDVYNPAYLTEEELEAVMQEFIATNNIEGMQQVANRIVQKGANQWNETEAKFITESLLYAFENDANGIISAITDGLVCVGNPDNFYFSDHINPEFKGYIMGDTEKLALIMSNIDTERDIDVKAYLTEISRMCVEVNPVYLNPHGPSMEDFWTTNGLSDYEGRLIETCAIFEKGNLNLFIRTCPDGECADMIKEQQVYGIFITDSVYIDYVPSDSSGLSVQLTETMEYQDVMSTLTEEQRNEWEKTILKFLGCCGTNLLDEGKGKMKDLAGDIIKEGLDEDVIKCLGPVGFVTGQICSLSKDMKEWAEQYQEELTNLIHKCIEIENGNLIKDAVLLNMNVVTSYSGTIENATLEGWGNINGTEPDILKGTEWTAGIENLLADDYMQMTYLGVFDGDEYNASTEEKVQALNQQLKDGMELSDPTKKDEISKIENWLEVNGLRIEGLTYEDYINMDSVRINAVKFVISN